MRGVCVGFFGSYISCFVLNEFSVLGGVLKIEDWEVFKFYVFRVVISVLEILGFWFI